MTFHYVYELQDAENQMRYIGVRTSDIEPDKDPYMSSSKVVRKLLHEGRKFTKTILSCWNTRSDAVVEEARLHRLYDVGLNPDFYNLACAPFLANHGSYLKGRSYEEIHGIEKAQSLKALRSAQFKNREFTIEQKRKMKENHADVSGANNPKAIAGSLFNKEGILLFTFSCKKELKSWCVSQKIPHRRLSKEGRYSPNQTVRNKKFSHLFGLYIEWNSDSG